MIYFLEILKALFLGIVEGITEWLPISSTGHMILVDEFIDLDVSPSFKEMFFVVIQLGAIAAVPVLFWNRINPFSRRKNAAEKRATWNLWGKVIVGVLPAAVLGLLFDDFFDQPFVFHTKDSSAFLEHFKTAEKKWKNKKTGFSLKCKSELYEILYKMQSEHRFDYRPKTKLEIIKPAVEYIHERYSIESIGIEKLSKLCNITPEYFRSIFKANFGTSPVKYINAIKIARAKELLDSNMYSVTEAATLSGFNDISHFSREFKRSCGQNPSQYAKAPR
jgi:AraC-like DNA-binding protein